jgi:hypothetical protein
MNQFETDSKLSCIKIGLYFVFEAFRFKKCEMKWMSAGTELDI